MRMREGAKARHREINVKEEVGPEPERGWRDSIDNERRRIIAQK